MVHWRREWQPLQYSCLENPMNSMKRQKDRTLKCELPRSVGAKYATGDQWRNNSRKNEGMEPKQKQYPVVDVTGDRSKVQCCKEQCCIGTWNVRSMKEKERKWSLSVMSNSATPWAVAYQVLCLWNFPGKNTGMGCHFLPQGILPTQGSNLGLLHCGQTLYHLNRQGSP